MEHRLSRHLIAVEKMKKIFINVLKGKFEMTGNKTVQVNLK